MFKSGNLPFGANPFGRANNFNNCGFKEVNSDRNWSHVIRKCRMPLEIAGNFQIANARCFVWSSSTDYWDSNLDFEILSHWPGTSLQEMSAAEGADASDDRCLLENEIGEDKSEGEKTKPTPSWRTYTPHQKWTLLILALGNFSTSLAFSLLSSFFPEEAYAKGASVLMVGVIFGVFEFCVFVSAPVFGAYITTLGSQFLFYSGLFTTGVTTILFGFLDRSPQGTPFVALCVVLRCVSGLGLSAYVTASFAVVTKTFPSQAATMMGTLESVAGLAFMIGPPVGGGLYNLGGWITPFLTLGIYLLGVLAISAWKLPAVDDRVTEHRGSMLKILTLPAALIAGVSLAVSAMSFSFLDPTLQPIIERDMNHTASPFIVGLIFLCGSVVYTLLSPLWGMASDKWPSHCMLMMTFGFVTLGTAFMVMGPAPFFNMSSPNVWTVCVAMVLFGLGAGASIAPVFKTCLDELTSNGYPDNYETYGLVSGLFNSLFSLGACVGPFVQGAVGQKYGLGWACMIASGANFLLIFLVLPFYLHRRCSAARRPSRPAPASVQSGDVLADDALLVP